MNATRKIVIVGHGAAGLTAALAASEEARATGNAVDLTVVERSVEGEHGGNTRFTPCYMRLEAPGRLSPGFVDDMIAVSSGQNDRAYFEKLAEEAPATMMWMQTHGIEFHNPVYYLSVGPPRIQPIGAGESIIRELTRAAKEAGVRFRYGCLAETLERGGSGRMTGLRITDTDGRSETIAADVVILACGGFQGDPTMLREHLGAGGETLRMISPGTRLNAGHGIRMALAVGARPAGDWRGMHIEPIDPRSRGPAPVVLVYPYGIVVDTAANRFFDEGAGLVHETWEEFARSIHFDCRDSEVYAILDSRLLEIENYGRAIRSEVAPFKADTLEELARMIGIPAVSLESTVGVYNSACTGDPAKFDATDKDGLAAAAWLIPPKSNWARAIERPPFLAYPLIGAIAYTFGGIATDTCARVLGESGPITGLFAAGEITGHFHGTAPNAVAVLRAAVYGRIAGREAARASTP
jgi:tricarballylate dehydrogenase